MVEKELFESKIVISLEDTELLAETKKRKEAEELRAKTREEKRIARQQLIEKPPPLPTGQYRTMRDNRSPLRYVQPPKN